MRVPARSCQPVMGAPERQICLAMLYESIGLLTAMADRCGLDLTVVIEPQACHDFEQEGIVTESFAPERSENIFTRSLGVAV